MDKPLISLCMPTNGVIEWVFPVLDSIYLQQVEESLFEVVITDNGNNTEFKEQMKKYIKNHDNMVYEETQALPFINEIEAYKRASGELLKFVNHRTKLLEGTLQRIVNYARDNIDVKPITYFSNGVLKKEKSIFEYKTFDEFVRNLSYWSSWSTGMTIWQSDFEQLPDDVSGFNELFPHTNVLFNERHRGRYVIDNSIIFDEMPQGKKPKGDYNLYNAFGIEYPGIILDLFRDGDISVNTFKTVADENLGFVSQLYFNYNVRKQYCSYNLSGLNDMYGVFYSKHQLVCKMYSQIAKGVFRKITRRNKR